MCQAVPGESLYEYATAAACSFTTLCRFFQVPKKLLERLQAQLEGEEEFDSDEEGDEGAAGAEAAGEWEGGAGAGRDGAEEEKWQQFDDLVDSWLVRDGSRVQIGSRHLIPGPQSQQ